MTNVVQDIVNGLGLGGTYALLALGLALVFSILRLINFAYGELMTITGYICSSRSEPVWRRRLWWCWEY